MTTRKNTDQPRRKRSSKNGQANPPAPSTPLPPPVADDPPEFQPEACRITVGRMACTVRRQAVDWFVPDLIPSACLSFVVGAPGAGKSTFGAWLCAKARRPAILPGSEESVESLLVPRLAANQAPLERCLILDGRLWSFPFDRAALAGTLSAHRADLLWIDPIDTYVGECSENDGQGVRAALEALSRVAGELGCAIVAARHPGKDLNNLCPGSRQWRAVPRVIVSLVCDDGPPRRRYLRLAKDPFDAGQQPREFNLGGEPGEPKRFSLGPALEEGEADIMAVSDPIDRWKVDQARALLEHLLKETEQESAYVYQVAERERLSDRTMRMAAKRLGVIIRREGNGREHRSYWRLPSTSTPVTPAETQGHTQSG